ATHAPFAVAGIECGLESVVNLAQGLAITTALHILFQEFSKFSLQLRQGDAILRPLRTGYAGHTGREIEFKHRAGIAFASARNAEHALRFEIVSHRVDLFVRSTGRL